MYIYQLLNTAQANSQMLKEGQHCCGLLLLHGLRIEYKRKRHDSTREKCQPTTSRHGRKLTALSSCRIIASNSSWPRCHRRRVPVMQLDKERLFSWTFWHSSADGTCMFSIPMLDKLICTYNYSDKLTSRQCNAHDTTTWRVRVANIVLFQLRG